MAFKTFDLPIQIYSNVEFRLRIYMFICSKQLIMLQAVIYYIVTMILTKELVIATDQCTKYRFKSPFFPGVSCEDVYNKNPESRDRSVDY